MSFINLKKTIKNVAKSFKRSISASLPSKSKAKFDDKLVKNMQKNKSVAPIAPPQSLQSKNTTKITRDQILKRNSDVEKIKKRNDLEAKKESLRKELTNEEQQRNILDIEREIINVDSTRSSEEISEDTYFDDNGEDDFLYQAPEFDSAEKSIQIGPKLNDLKPEEIPKILSIQFYDTDSNGFFDSCVIEFKRLYAESEGKVLFRELSYEIYRKSIFEDEDYEKIGTILSENFSEHTPSFVNLDSDFETLSNEDVQKKSDTLRFTDKDIKSGKVYAYKIKAIYDGESNLVSDSKKNNLLQLDIKNPGSRLTTKGKESSILTAENIFSNKNSVKTSKDLLKK